LGRGGVVREITLLSRNSEENEEDEEEFRWDYCWWSSHFENLIAQNGKFHLFFVVFCLQKQGYGCCQVEFLNFPNRFVQLFGSFVFWGVFSSVAVWKKYHKEIRILYAFLYNLTKSTKSSGLSLTSPVNESLQITNVFE
jgi:hypothetical protein